MGGDGGILIQGVRYASEREHDQVIRLAQARQAIAERTGLPSWDGLTDGDRELLILNARNYYRAAVECGLIPDDRIPSAAQIRAWLTAHNWTLRGTGNAGTLWSPPIGGASVGVLQDFTATWQAEGAIARIADREGRAAADVRREMLAMEVPGGS